MMMTRTLMFAATLAGLLVAACAAKGSAPGSVERVCTPGAYVVCHCDNKSAGTKLCHKDGQTFDACSSCDDAGAGDTVPVTPTPTPRPTPTPTPTPGVDSGPDPAPGGCSGKSNGFNWMPDDPNERCCDGKQVTTTTNSDCGACGTTCNAANGEACGLVNGHYFCVGCETSAGCWSGCCSTEFAPTGACAASDCSAGDCDGTRCPLGAHCVLGAPSTSNYCAY